MTSYLTYPVACVNCGVIFAMTDDYLEMRKKDRKSFYCPNGHTQSYTGKTDKEKLADMAGTLAKTERAKEEALRAARELQACLDRQAQARREAVARGNATKARKRAEAKKQMCSCGKPFPEDGGIEGGCECCSMCTSEQASV